MAGGNAFMMFSSIIYKEADASHNAALIGTVLLGATAVDGVYSYSLIVEGKGRGKIALVFGRKKTMIVGTLILCLCQFILAFLAAWHIAIVGRERGEAGRPKLD